MLFRNTIQAVLRQMDQLLQPICHYIKQDTIVIHTNNVAFFYILLTVHLNIFILILTILLH